MVGTVDVAAGSIKLSGPGLKKLRALEKRITDTEHAKRAIAVAQAEESISLVQEGFREERDPYNKKWKKRKRETRQTVGKKVLSRTGRLRNSWFVERADSRGFVIAENTRYALPHQRPRRGRRPQRAMVPLTGRFPKKWRRPLNEAATEALTEIMGGA